MEGEVSPKRIGMLCAATAFFECGASSSSSSSAGDWDNYQHDPYHTGRTSASFDPRKLQLAWSLPGGYFKPIVSGNQVFVSRNSVLGSEYASFDLHSGRRIWGGNFADGIPSSAATVCDGLFVTLDYNSMLRTYDAATGQLLHQLKTGNSVTYNQSAPLLVDVPGAGVIDAYVNTPDGFTRYTIDRFTETRRWTTNGGSSGVPTLAGDSIIGGNSTAAIAYRISDGASNLFFRSNVTSGDSATGLFDPSRNRFYSVALIGGGSSEFAAFDYAAPNNVQLLWHVDKRPETQGAAALDPSGELLWVNSDKQLGVYSPDDGSLLRSTPLPLTPGYTPVVQDGYVWTTGNNGKTTYALDLNTLEPVASFDGGCPGGGYYWSSALVFDDGIVISGSRGLDFYVVPEPTTAGLLTVVGIGAMTRLHRHRTRLPASSSPK